MPEIKTITFERLINTGDYSHIKISATADVIPGENPEEAMKQLEDYVNDKAPKTYRNYREYDIMLGSIRQECDRQKSMLNNAKAEYQKVAEVLRVHGIEIEPLPVITQEELEFIEDDVEIDYSDNDYDPFAKE